MLPRCDWDESEVGLFVTLESREFCENCGFNCLGRTVGPNDFAVKLRVGVGIMR